MVYNSKDINLSFAINDILVFNFVLLRPVKKNQEKPPFSDMSTGLFQLFHRNTEGGFKMIVVSIPIL